eukprot:COSAG02_NODE_5398_length_4363_cov_4.830675_2_plen_183_part_00
MLEAGSQVYVGKYDAKRELFTVVGKRQTLDYSSVDADGGYVWAAAGTNGPDPTKDAGRLLTAAWVRGGGNGRVACDEAKLSEDGCPSVVSLVRSISWDSKTKQLVSFPVKEYESLRNHTYEGGSNNGSTFNLAAQQGQKRLAIPSGVGSLDVLVSFEVRTTLNCTAVAQCGSSIRLRWSRWC